MTDYDGPPFPPVDAYDEPSPPITRKPSTDKRPPARIRLSEVTEVPVEWYWRPWIPFGAITVVDGDPGVGKTTLMLERIARGTRGDLERDCREPMSALVISTEDSAAHTVVPRLRVAGADLERVFAPEDVWDLDEGVDQDGAGGLVNLERHVVETGARVVLLDPLVAFMGGDTHKDGEVRRVLGPLARLAERHRLAVIAIRHLKKANDGPALYRGGGSIGIIGAARSGLVVGRDPGDSEGKRLVIASSKSNLGPAPRALAWRLVPPYPGPDGPCGVEWLGPSQLTADELLGPRPTADSRAAEALEWLQAKLALGPQPVRELRKAAMREAVAWRTVERAKDAAGVRSKQAGDGWVWFGPEAG